MKKKAIISSIVFAVVIIIAVIIGVTAGKNKNKELELSPNMSISSIKSDSVELKLDGKKLSNEQILKEKITFTSTDESIVKVDQSGKITALKNGETTIKVRYNKKDYLIKIKVNVKELKTEIEPQKTEIEPQKNDEFKLNIPNSVKLYQDSKSKINVGTQDQSILREIKYKSENESIATVSNNGEITGVVAGNTNIVISYKTQKYSLYVDILSYSFSVNSTLINLYTEDISKIEVDIPVKVEGYNLTFESSDNQIVTVDNTGNLKAISAGSANINVTYGKKSISVNVDISTYPVKFKSDTLEIVEGSTKLMDTSLFSLNNIKDLKITSLNTEIATINDDLNISAVKPGETKIAIEYDHKTTFLNIIVKEWSIPVLNNRFVYTGAMIKTNPGTDDPKILEKIQFIVENEEIALVNKNGIIIGLKEGRTNVHVIYNNNENKKQFFEIEVSNPPYKLKDKIEVYLGEKNQKTVESLFSTFNFTGINQDSVKIKYYNKDNSFNRYHLLNNTINGKIYGKYVGEDKLILQVGETEQIVDVSVVEFPLKKPIRFNAYRGHSNTIDLGTTEPAIINNVKYKILDTTIASIASGILTGNKVGQTTIEIEYDGIKYSTEVLVREYNIVAKMPTVMFVGDTHTIQIESNDANTKAKYSYIVDSKYSDKLTINNGVITANKASDEILITIRYSTGTNTHIDKVLAMTILDKIEFEKSITMEVGTKHDVNLIKGNPADARLFRFNTDPDGRLLVRPGTTTIEAINIGVTNLYINIYNLKYILPVKIVEKTVKAKKITLDLYTGENYKLQDLDKNISESNSTYLLDDDKNKNNAATIQELKFAKDLYTILVGSNYRIKKFGTGNSRYYEIEPLSAGIGKLYFVNGGVTIEYTLNITNKKGLTVKNNNVVFKYIDENNKALNPKDVDVYYNGTKLNKTDYILTSDNDAVVRINNNTLEPVSNGNTTVTVKKDAEEIKINVLVKEFYSDAGDGQKEKVVEYKTGLNLKIYYPTNAKYNRLRTFIYVHGGFFTQGDLEYINRDTQAEIKKALLKRGYAVVSIDYTLLVDNGATDKNIWRSISDVKDSIKFLRANADTYKLDSNNFTIMGSSAGGTLAGLATVTDDKLTIDYSSEALRGVSSEVEHLFMINPVTSPYLTMEMLISKDPSYTREYFTRTFLNKTPDQLQRSSNIELFTMSLLQQYGYNDYVDNNGIKYVLNNNIAYNDREPKISIYHGNLDNLISSKLSTHFTDHANKLYRSTNDIDYVDLHIIDNVEHELKAPSSGNIEDTHNAISIVLDDVLNKLDVLYRIV